MHLTRNPIDPKKHGQGNELERNQDAQQTGDAASGGDEVIKETEGESIQKISSPWGAKQPPAPATQNQEDIPKHGNAVPDNGEGRTTKTRGVKEALSRGEGA